MMMKIEFTRINLNSDLVGKSDFNVGLFRDFFKSRSEKKTKIIVITIETNPIISTNSGKPLRINNCPMKEYIFQNEWKTIEYL
ncbi:MAG: hypothetical protein JSV04_00960, partial [Candidatus Heimdallarchaeota archaeon]